LTGLEFFELLLDQRGRVAEEGGCSSEMKKKMNLIDGGSYVSAKQQSLNYNGLKNKIKI
jgi:hypothetical protein